MNMDKITIEVADLGKVSDGYHTIEELYDHRITLYIALCRLIAVNYKDYGDLSPWRSKLHHDGTGYDGWFMLGLHLAEGKQITYHLPMSRWAETEFAVTSDKAPVPFDGHTPQDVLDRLKKL